MDNIKRIYLCEMTPAKMQMFFKEFAYDPDVFSDTTQCKNYVYDEQKADDYYRKQSQQGRIHYAVMLGEKVIGDVYLKRIDHKKKCCTFAIHLVNDSVKNKGYGTRAEELMLTYVFEELQLETVFADCLIKNERSQHVLTKVGFMEINRDNEYVYYKCQRSMWRKAGI